MPSSSSGAYSVVITYLPIVQPLLTLTAPHATSLNMQPPAPDKGNTENHIASPGTASQAVITAHPVNAVNILQLFSNFVPYFTFTFHFFLF
jgi:hypothetical protein